MNTSSSPPILIHTWDAGGPYYVGDVYEPSRIGQSGELIDENLLAFKGAAPTSKPYLRYLESLSHGWPHISYLADSMKVTTSPPKQRFMTEAEKSQRASRTKVAILTFEPDNLVRRGYYDDIKFFSDALNDPGDTDENICARLYVVEDVSRDVIEALGYRFDVDPHFFRGHISDYLWHNTRDPWVELPDLDIVSRKRSYLHLNYVQARYFRDQESVQKAKWVAIAEQACERRRAR